MTLVSWLLVFGAVIILALVIDLARRFFTNSPFEEFDSLDSAILSYPNLNEFDELPNGGKAQVVASEEASNVDMALAADSEPDASTQETVTVDENISSVKDAVTQSADHSLADEVQVLDDEAAVVLAEPIVVESAKGIDADAIDTLNIENTELNDDVIISAFSDWQQQEDTVEVNNKTNDQVHIDSQHSVSADTVNNHNGEPEEHSLPDDLSTEYEYARHYQEDTQFSAAELYQDNEQEQSHTNDMMAHTQNDTLDKPIGDTTLTSTKPLEPLDITRPVYEVLETPGIVQADLFGDVAVGEPASEAVSMSTVSSSIQAENAAETTHDDVLSMSPEQTEQAATTEINTSSNYTDIENRDSADASISNDQNILLDYTKVPSSDQTPRSQKSSQQTVSKSLTARFRQFVFPFSEDSHYSDELRESQDKTIVLDASLDPRKRQIELNIALRLQLPSQGALGKNIADLLSHCDCEFDSEHSLFHRYESADAEYMQFSVAADTHDGNFADEFENEHYMSIVFFMVLPGVNKGTYALECMVKTARYLAESLHGELFDFRQGVLCEQTITHFNKTIRDYERRRLVKLRAEGQR